MFCKGRNIKVRDMTHFLIKLCHITHFLVVNLVVILSLLEKLKFVSGLPPDGYTLPGYIEDLFYQANRVIDDDQKRSPARPTKIATAAR